ncbi:neuronal-specific septin-3 isoform X2 [Phyllopteryx taeniolatus]|uniref:neuronal-specific septin-3 isoform X2 n=1 Tax=Phyllopteryx taeniolatus TaxID=161469 RepID=UPI002AD4C9AA|nr:neuronal-specific septin-3 isoform X2 [Phyllopteryx taeniolatus]
MFTRDRAPSEDAVWALNNNAASVCRNHENGPGQPATPTLSFPVLLFVSLYTLKSDNNQTAASVCSSTCIGPACSRACPSWSEHGQHLQRNDGEITFNRPPKPSGIFSPKTNASPSDRLQLKPSFSLHPGVPSALAERTEPRARRDRLDRKARVDFTNRAQFLQCYPERGYEKMHPESQAAGWMTPAKSAASWEDQLGRHSKEDTQWTLSNTTVNDLEVEQDRSCQSRGKTQTMQAPWRTHMGTQFKTCLVHPVQASPAPHIGIAPPNVNEVSASLKGSRCHGATAKVREHPLSLDAELFDGPSAAECSKKTSLPGGGLEDPYYVSISYTDSVYEDMSDIVPPEVRPKPAVPAKPPNVGAPSPSGPFPPQGPGAGGAGVSAPPHSAIPVPVGSHGPSHGGSHAFGLGAAHAGGHGHDGTGGGSALLGYIGIDAIIEQMRKKTMKTGFDFNIMVVGHSGLGKSTLVNTLFKSQVSRRSAGWSRDDKIPKTVEIKSVSHVIEEGGVKMKLTVVDTPGFGDLINNDNCWEPISKYINEQYEKFLKEEVNITRKKRIPDTRVHCCLYFISPTGHTLRQLDVEFMKRLSHSVNIIPVIAKADTVTPEERQEFKQRVKKELEMNGIEFYPQKEFDEDMEDKSDNDKIREAMPFAVVGSDKEYQVNGKRVLGRKTAWGVVEVENMNHCEFAQLRDFIIRSHLQDLKEVTHSIHYETYRAKRLHENGGLHPVDAQESNL